MRRFFKFEDIITMVRRSGGGATPPSVMALLKGELGEKSRPDASLGNPYPPLQLLLPPSLVTTCLLLLLFFPLFTQKTTCPFYNTSCGRLKAVLGRLRWSYKEVSKGGDCPEDEAKADQSLASFQSFKHPWSSSSGFGAEFWVEQKVSECDKQG